MTLCFFDDAKGLWIREEGEDGTVPFSRSSVDVSVTDGSGRVMNGTLTVNGTPFKVEKGRCKLLTEALSRFGFSSVEFLTQSGVKLFCSHVRQICDYWYFPTPREAMSNDDILLILRRIERLREKLESAKSLCSEKVSTVLGI